MENNNNNGRGIFYGVIGVATLVVAIIGATFAYFSATAVSNNGVNVGTATIDLAFLNERRQFSQAMIPVDSSINSFGNYIGIKNETEDKVSANTESIGQGTCTDNDGNAICGIYEFTVNNPSTVSQTVYGSLIVTEVSEGLTHMKYAVFKGSVEDIEEKIVTGTNTKFVLGTDKAVASAAVGETVIAPRLFNVTKEDGAFVKDDWGTYTQQTLAPGASQTYTVVFWLEEAGGDNVGEAGKMLTAEITFDTGTTSGVTGNLTAIS